MAWNEQWSIKVDGNEMNTLPAGGVYVAMIPELENLPEYDPVTVPIDGSFPAYIRLQPRETTWTLNIAMKGCNWATYQSRLATLRGILSYGIHTLTVQVRGQAAPLSATIVVRGMMVNPKMRAASWSLFVPNPTLTP